MELNYSIAEDLSSCLRRNESLIQFNTHAESSLVEIIAILSNNQDAHVNSQMPACFSVPSHTAYISPSAVNQSKRL